MASASVTPAARHADDAVRAVVATQEVEACFLDESLVLAPEREDEEADRGTDRDLLAREQAGDDDRIGEEDVAARLEQAMPIPKHVEPVGEVVDGVDANDGVERRVLEWQQTCGVGLFEAGERGHVLSARALGRRLDCLGVDVDAVYPDGEVAGIRPVGSQNRCKREPGLEGKDVARPPSVYEL